MFARFLPPCVRSLYNLHPLVFCGPEKSNVIFFSAITQGAECWRWSGPGMNAGAVIKHMGSLFFRGCFSSLGWSAHTSVPCYPSFYLLSIFFTFLKPSRILEPVWTYLQKYLCLSHKIHGIFRAYFLAAMLSEFHISLPPPFPFQSLLLGRVFFVSTWLESEPWPKTGCEGWIACEIDLKARQRVSWKECREGRRARRGTVYGNSLPPLLPNSMFSGPTFHPLCNFRSPIETRFLPQSSQGVVFQPGPSKLL